MSDYDEATTWALDEVGWCKRPVKVTARNWPGAFALGVKTVPCTRQGPHEGRCKSNTVAANRATCDAAFAVVGDPPCNACLHPDRFSEHSCDGCSANCGCNQGDSE